MNRIFASARRTMLGAVALFALTALLAGCTVYFVEGEPRSSGRVSLSLDLNEVITEFEPNRGVGASYRIGQRVSFRLRARQDGYVTLTAIDPDGSVYPLARNLRVYAGQMNVLSGSQLGVVFIADPPTGLHRVRASFTTDQTDTSRVDYRGRSGESGWTTAIRIELTGAPVRDVAETYLYIERR